MGSPSNPAAVLNSLADMLNKFKEMRGQPGQPEMQRLSNDVYYRDKMLPAISSQLMTKQVLQHIGKMLEENKGSYATNTGKFSGEYWREVPEYEGGVERARHPIASTLLGGMADMMEPGSTGKRAELEQLMRRMGEAAFEKGGKQLTGTELGVTMGGLPSMFMEEEQNIDNVHRALTRDVYDNVQLFKKLLMGRGYSEPFVNDLMTKFLQEEIKFDPNQTIAKPWNQEK